MKTTWHKKLFSLPISALLLWLEALLLLAMARFLVWAVPFKYWVKFIGETNSASTTYQQINISDKRLRRIQWAIQSAAYRAPWQAVCLPQAIAAKWMLAFRGQPSKLYLGLKSDHEGSGKLAAHAWLECCQKTVTGGTADEFTCVSHFI